MKKNKFVRRRFFVFIIVAVVFFASLLILNTIASNMMYHKIKSICKSSFNCNVKMRKPHVDILRGKIVFNNISIDKHIGKRKFNVNVNRMFIKVNMTSAVKNILYRSNRTTEFFANIDFEHKKRIRADFAGNVNLRSSKGDFSLKMKSSDIDMASMGQNDAYIPVYVKKGTVTVSLVGTCKKGVLNFSQHILTKNLLLSIKKAKDLDSEVFIGLTYRDIINYVKVKNGEIDMSFNVNGTLKEPEVDLSPIMENILIEIMTLKIS